MNYYVIDIETKPQEDLVGLFMEDRIEKAEKKLQNDLQKAKTYKKPETVAKHSHEAHKAYKEAIDPKAQRKAMSVDTDYSEIMCVGVKPEGEEAKTYTIEEFAIFLNKALEDGVITLITFNGKKFDLPVLIKNGIKKNLDLPYMYLKECAKRYGRPDGNIKHIDLFEELGSTGDYKSLTTYTQIYLGKKKENDSEDFFETATEEDIKKRCIEDVNITEELFNKFSYLV